MHPSPLYEPVVHGFWAFRKSHLLGHRKISFIYKCFHKQQEPRRGAPSDARCDWTNAFHVWCETNNDTHERQYSSTTIKLSILNITNARKWLTLLSFRFAWDNYTTKALSLSHDASRSKFQWKSIFDVYHMDCTPLHQSVILKIYSCVQYAFLCFSDS